MLSDLFAKLLFVRKILRTVSIAEANKKCKNYSGNPSEEREQQDNRHRSASPVGNGQRGKDYAQEIPWKVFFSKSFLDTLFAESFQRMYIAELPQRSYIIYSVRKIVRSDNI